MLRATRPPAQECGTQSVPPKGHNTPLPLKRSPPVSFKRLLGRTGLRTPVVESELLLLEIDEVRSDGSDYLNELPIDVAKSFSVKQELPAIDHKGGKISQLQREKLSRGRETEKTIGKQISERVPVERKLDGAARTENGFVDKDARGMG